MDTFITTLHHRAAAQPKTIVLPETDDPRILRAAETIHQLHLAKLLLIGIPDTVHRRATSLGIDLSGMEIIDPITFPDISKMTQALYNRREHKGMTLASATSLITTDALMFGAMLVDMGMADGMVAGSTVPTNHTIRAAIYGVGTALGITTVSSFFLMMLPNKTLGCDGVLFYADCAVVPHPDSRQLAEIAISTARSYRALMGAHSPKIALLSFSTKGSAHDDSVTRVVEAVSLVKSIAPDILIDGELQFDAAILPSVAERKAPGSSVAGHADILVFPDLNAGNIGYKITERLGGAIAIGPILQGTRKPINDLSRGCSVDDIVNVTAITVLQAGSSSPESTPADEILLR